MLGFLMLQFGLLLSACPIRIVILSAYGSLTGIAGWASVVAGVLVVTVLMRWSARRAAVQAGDIMTAALATLVLGFVTGYLRHRSRLCTCLVPKP